MELLYLWVDKFKSLQDFHVVLIPKYKEISFPELKNNRLAVNLEKKDDYINLYGENLNILAFIGANGSGKSNIVNLVSYILRADIIDDYSGKNKYLPYDEKVLPEKYCLIYKTDEGFYVSKKGVISVQLKLNNDENSTLILDAVAPDVKVAKFCPFLRKENLLLEDNDIEFHDFSINYRLDNYFYYDRFENYDVKKSLSRIFGFNSLKLFKDNPQLMFELCGYELYLKKAFELNNQNMNYWHDVVRRRHFFSEISRKNLIGKINHATRAILRTYKASYKSFDSKASLKTFAQKALPLLCLHRAITEFFKSSVFFNDPVIINVLKTYFSEGFNNISGFKFRDSKHRIKFYSDIFSAISSKQPKFGSVSIFHYDRLKNLLSTFISYEENLDKDANFIVDNFEIIKSYDEKIIRIKQDLMFDSKDYYLPVYKFENNKKKMLYAGDNVFSKMFQINFYKKDSASSVYSFDNISTGEQRILKFYADILGVYKYSKEKFSVSTFIFDEMDLSWHPEWQRHFVDYVIDIFKHFKGVYNLFFTTHSPFILSDLTRENIVLLNKDNSFHTKICENNMQTFGANIHNLFKDNFFLNCDYGCTMGEFAKAQIQQLSKKLCSKEIENYNQAQLEDLEKRINLIGETLIRSAFLKKLYSLPIYIMNNKSYTDLCVEIAELKRQLNEKNKY